MNNETTIIAQQGMADQSAAMLRRSWAIAGCTLLLIGFYLLALYHEAVIAAVNVWIVSPTYNHGFLILPICLYLVWERRELFQQIAPRPNLVFVLALPLVGVVWLIADVASVMEGMQIALVAMMQVAIVTLLGWRAYRAFMFPALYMFFLVPMGDYLVPPLQDFTADFSVAALRLVGIPVFVDGIFISVPNGHFRVAEACAGLRFLIATIAFGFLFANLMYRSFTRRAIFIALCIVVPIIANGFRAFGIILIAYLSNNELAVGVDHIVYGWVFFSFILLMLIWIGLQFREADTLHRAAGTEGGTLRPVSAQSLVASGAAIMAMAAVGPAFAAYLSHLQPTADPTRLAAPSATGEWKKSPSTSDWQPIYNAADGIVSQAYKSSNGEVDLFIAFFNRQTNDSEVIASDNRVADDELWNVVEIRGMEIDVNGVRTPFIVSRLVSGGRQRLVLQTYWIGSSLTTSRLRAKLLQVYGELVTGHRAAAAVLLSTDIKDGPDVALDRLKGFLEQLEPLDRLLESAG